jgi:hypothetical protein
MAHRLFLASLILFSSSLYAAERSSFIINNYGSEIVVATQGAGRTVLRVSLGRVDYEKESIDGTESHRLFLPEEFGQTRGVTLGPEGAALPTITRLIAVPFDSDPQLRVVSSHSAAIENVKLAPADDEIAGGDGGAERWELARGEIAGVMRDLRLYTITISPIRYDSEGNSLEVFDEIEIEISHAGTQITRYDCISEAFAPIYRSLVDNPAVFDPIAITRGAYWIILADTFRSDVMTLYDWKKAKGFDVVFIIKSQIGPNTYTNIRNYIRTRFDTCLVKPDYITIVGDVYMPSNRGIATHIYEYSASDNFYTFLSGADYFPEVLIGRIAVDNTNDIARYLTKLLTYERPPDPGDLAWLRRAVMVAGGEQEEDDRSTHRTKLLCREWMLADGFDRVETLFVNYSQGDPTAADIVAAIDAGAGYVNRRGWGGSEGWWVPQFDIGDIQSLNNAPHFPIMTSVGEATGDFEDAVCFGEAWIRGNNRGGAGFIGNSNHFSHTVYDNPVDVGIFWGLFEEGVTTLAQAQLMGKMTLYNAFPNKRNRGDQVELYFNSYNVLGDPEVNCWTGAPREMGFFHADSIPVGQNVVGLRIIDEMGAPIGGAAVCLWKGDEIFETGFTGPDGIRLLEVSASTAGPMRATATARGFAPVEDTILFFASPMVVTYLNHVVNDDELGESSGDDDGIANPSETIELLLGLRNLSTESIAALVTCQLVNSSPFMEVLRDTASYADILPGDSAYCATPYLIRVADDAPDQADPALFLDISTVDNHYSQGVATLSLAAPAIMVDSAVVIGGDGNGRFDPGETAYLRIHARNSGSKAILGATGVLRSADLRAQIDDSTAAFGDCPPGGTFVNTADDLPLAIAPGTFRGHLLNFEIEFSGQRSLGSTASFAKTVGQVTTRDPVGPDGYGYYCFDDTDTSYAEHPIYEWVNIDTLQWPFELVPEDGVDTIPLPFTVRYYGQAFDELTICNNGFVTLGASWWGSPSNTGMPSIQCGPGMIAPCWDDFRGPLRIYYSHDTVQSRFIIGWPNSYNEGNNQNVRCEIIIFDENIYPTITGDNEIVFQYQLIGPPYTYSVGTCSPDRRNGIGYIFNGLYADGAATMTTRRALKFTTGRPRGWCQYLLGDINANGATNGLDIVYAVRYFRGGVAPPNACDCPPFGTLYAAGDVNGNCAFNGLDLTYMVAFFKGGAALSPCTYCPPQPEPARAAGKSGATE